MTRVAFNMPYHVELEEEDRYGRPLALPRMGRVAVDIPEIDSREFTPRVRMEDIFYFERDGLLWAPMTASGDLATLASLRAAADLVGTMDFRPGGRAVEVNPLVVRKPLFSYSANRVSFKADMRVERDTHEMSDALLASYAGKEVLDRTRQVVLVDDVFYSRRHGPVQHYNLWPNKHTKSGLNGTWTTADRIADGYTSIFEFGMDDNEARDEFLERQGRKPFVHFGFIEPTMLSDAPVKDVLVELAIERCAFSVLNGLEELDIGNVPAVEAAIKLRNVLQDRFPGQRIDGLSPMDTPRPAWDTEVPDASGLLAVMDEIGETEISQDSSGYARVVSDMLADRIAVRSPSPEDDEIALEAAFR